MIKHKIVITGGAGFIGSHIAEYWAERDAEVHVIDNLRSGSLKNLEHLEKIFFHRVSISRHDEISKIIEGADYVFHLAALISVPESVNNPRECIEININGLLNVLEASVKHNVKKVVFSSSAAVYGDNPVSPKTIDLQPNPKSPYGITKLDGEYYLKFYNEKYGLGAVSLRYFNVFGPRQNPNSQYAAAVPIFVSRAVSNKPIVIYGDGEQTRDFVYVKDVVRANVIAAESEVQTGIFNVGTGKKISIKELAEFVIKKTNSSSEILYEKEREGDIKHSLADIYHSTNILGYSPSFNIESGLSETVKYFEGHNG